MKNEDRRGIEAIIMLILLTIICLSSGCIGFGHSRKVGEVRESTFVLSIFQKSAVDAIRSKTKDGTYLREVGAERFTSAADSEGIKATGGAVGQGAKEFVRP